MTDAPGGPPIPPDEEPSGYPPPPPGESAPPGWTLPPPPPASGAYEPEAPLPPLQMPAPSFPDLDERRYGDTLRPDGAGIRRARRLPPAFDTLLAVIGGLLLFIGMTELLEELPDDQEWWLSAAITGAVLAIAFVLATVVRTGPVVSGLLALAAPTAVLPASFIVAHEAPSFRVALAILLGVPLVLWLAAYLVGPMAGRPLLLGLVLAALWLLASAQIAYSTGSDFFDIESQSTTFTAAAQPTPSPDSLSPAQPLQPTPDRAPATGFLPPEGQPTDLGTPTTAPDETFVIPQPGQSFSELQPDDGAFDVGGEGYDPFQEFFGTSPFGALGNDLTERVGFVALGFGLVYLIVAFVLDSRRLSGAATAFVAVADVALVVAVVLLGIRFNGWGLPVAALGLGGLLASVGSSLNRRGTAWLGALGLLAGVGGLVTKLADELSDGDGATLEALLTVAAGLVALVLALAVNRGRGDDFGVEPPAGEPYA